MLRSKSLNGVWDNFFGRLDTLVSSLRDPTSNFISISFLNLLIMFLGDIVLLVSLFHYLGSLTLVHNFLSPVYLSKSNLIFLEIFVSRFR